MLVKTGRIRDNDSDQDSDSDASGCSRSDILEDISSYTICLMELVPSMERTLSHGITPKTRYLKGGAPIASSQVSESGRTCMQEIFDMFPKADTKLIDRLREANWKRHTIVRLRMDEVSSHTTADPGEDRANFRRSSALPDSGLGTSRPFESAFAASVVSNASTESSNADLQDKSRNVSSTPYEVATTEPFQCKICGKMLETTMQSTAWRYTSFHHEMTLCRADRWQASCSPGSSTIHLHLSQLQGRVGSIPYPQVVGGSRIQPTLGRDGLALYGVHRGFCQ